MPRTNDCGVTEVAHLRTNQKKYGEEHERIFGKKEKKFRRLMIHHESDSLFEEYLTDSELEAFQNTLDGSCCVEVTGQTIWEERFRGEQHEKL